MIIDRLEVLALALFAGGVAAFVFYIVPNIEIAIVALDHFTGAN